jgi:hypothetical protein
MKKHNPYTLTLALLATTFALAGLAYALKEYDLNPRVTPQAFADNMNILITVAMCLWAAYITQGVVVFVKQRFIDIVAIPAAACINTKTRIAARIASRLDK